MRNSFNKSPESKIFNLFELIKKLSESDVSVIHKILLDEMLRNQVKIRVGEIWMSHYKGELKSSDLKSHRIFIKKFNRLSEIANINLNYPKKIAYELIELYLLCELPGSESLLEKIRAKTIFENFELNGQIDFNISPKNRHLFLNSLN